jgi:hypothetical protein
MKLKTTVFLVALVLLTARAGAKDGEPAKGNPAASYVKVKVQVELRGILTVTKKEITVLVQEPDFNPAVLTEVTKARNWVLDLGAAKGLWKKARSWSGKAVIVRGSANLLGVKTQTFRYKGAVPAIYPAPKAPDLVGTRAVLDLERRVEVKELTKVAKE